MKKSLKKKNLSKAGFTLLELLVVVAIIAAIAGTSAIVFKDVDARAAAAAHVGMMDELNKGVRTYEVIQHGLPNRMDSLLTTGYVTTDLTDFELGVDALIVPLTGTGAITNVPVMMSDAGLTEMMYIDITSDGGPENESSFDCTVVNLKNLIQSKANMTVAGNIFLPPEANGCGTNLLISTSSSVVVWNGENARISGDATDDSVYMLTGIGPSCSLFDQSKAAALTTVPIYRHVGPTDYCRFIAVWKIGSVSGVTSGLEVTDVTGTSFEINEDGFELITILDGALDTKEEELGEWDGTRAT